MKWEKLKAKLAADPVWAAEYHTRKIQQQRKRYQNPEVRRRHALACQVWRLNKAAGITIRKKQAPHTKAELPTFREASFQISFND
jgi:hypothetical protein